MGADPQPAAKPSKRMIVYRLLLAPRLRRRILNRQSSKNLLEKDRGDSERAGERIQFRSFLFCRTQSSLLPAMPGIIRTWHQLQATGQHEGCSTVLCAMLAQLP